MWMWLGENRFRTTKPKPWHLVTAVAAWGDRCCGPCEVRSYCILKYQEPELDDSRIPNFSTGKKWDAKESTSNSSCSNILALNHPFWHEKTSWTIARCPSSKALGQQRCGAKLCKVLDESAVWAEEMLSFPEQHEKRAVGCKGCQMHTVQLTTPWWIICLEKCTMKMSTIPSASPRSVTVMMNFQTLATDVQILAGFLYNLHWKSSVCELSRTDSCENNVIINHFYIDTCLNLPPIRRISLFIFISIYLSLSIYIYIHISTYIYIEYIYIYIIYFPPRL
jgi:hypothetical protein